VKKREANVVLGPGSYEPDAARP